GGVRDARPRHRQMGGFRRRYQDTYARNACKLLRKRAWRGKPANRTAANQNDKISPSYQLPAPKLGTRIVAGQTAKSEVVRLARGNVRFGSKADILLSPTNVRFTPNSGHWNSAAQCPLCAKSGLMHCSKMLPMIWGCKTGRSAGLSPQRIGTEMLVSAACVTAAPLR